VAPVVCVGEVQYDVGPVTSALSEGFDDLVRSETM
jgi:hypothetical protein